jgi:hypothetical protein
MIGQTVVVDLIAYTDTVARRGDASTFTYDAIAKTTNATLDIAIEHKNRADTAWTTNVSFTQITAAGVATKRATGLKEQVRLKLTFGGTAASEWVHGRDLATVWETN